VPLSSGGAGANGLSRQIASVFLEDTILRLNPADELWQNAAISVNDSFYFSGNGDPVSKKRKQKGHGGTSITEARPLGPESGAPDYLRAGLLVIVCFLVYMPALRAGIIWDDETILFKNMVIQIPDGLWRIWTGRDFLDFIPLTLSNFWIQWRLWGMNPTGYHFVNVLLHSLNSILLFFIVKRMRITIKKSAGMLYAVHPVVVTSVAWIAELKNAQTMFFYLLAWLLFIHGEERRDLKFYVCSLIAFMCSLLSKASSVMMPVALLLYCWWRDGHITRKAFIKSIPFFLGAFCIGLITIYYQTKHSIGAAVVRPESMPSRIAGAGWVVWFYIYKTFLPIHLLMVYPRWNVDPRAWLAWLPLLALIIGVCGILLSRKRGIIALTLYYVAALAPVSGILPMSFHQYSLVADHLQQMALLAPIVGIAALWQVGISKWGRQNVTIGATALLVVLGGLSFQYAAHLKNEKTLWTFNTEKYPDCWIGYGNLSVYYADQGDLQTSLENSNKAIRLSPQRGNLYLNRGSTWSDLGNIQKAVEDTELALKYTPKDPDAWYNLGVLRNKVGDTTGTLQAYNKALELESRQYLALMNRGNIYFMRGQLEKALQDENHALKWAPNHPKALSIRANIYLTKHDFKRAEQDFAASLASDPNQVAAYNNRSVMWFMMNNYAAAVEDATRVLQLDPRNITAYFNRAEYWMHLRQFDQAWADIHAGEKLGAKPEPKLLHELQKRSGRMQ